MIYEELMFELGQDSEYHAQTGKYIEVVSDSLARFPDGWQGRAIRKAIGTMVQQGVTHEVVAIFPEIHDLTVAKLAVFRSKDREFLRGVVRLGLISKETLVERYRTAPRTKPERIAEGLSAIEEAFRESQ
jgi:hypothetical protein